ncbi:hypothetical protein BHM03_00047828, partial [Ensete ventricosum]
RRSRPRGPRVTEITAHVDLGWAYVIGSERRSRPRGPRVTEITAHVDLGWAYVIGSCFIPQFDVFRLSGYRGGRPRGPRVIEITTHIDGSFNEVVLSFAGVRLVTDCVSDVLVFSWSRGLACVEATVEMTSRSSSLSFSSSFLTSSSSVQSVEGPSGADEAMRLRPYVVSHDPPSSLGVEVVSSSSGGATSVDSIVLKALMIMQSCYNSDSIMMIRRLAEVWERFCIPTEYELHVPLPGQRPYDSFKLSTDALEAGL